MCHMVADTHEELLAMAEAIGLRRRWLQDAGTYREHFDVSLTKKREALARGAVEISRRELAAFLRERREERGDDGGTDGGGA